MTARRNLRITLALLAAYVIAVQSILVAAAVPLAGPAGHFGQPICSAARGTNQTPGTPAGPQHDCLTACLAAGCEGGHGTPAIGVASVVEHSFGFANVVEFQLQVALAVFAVATAGYDSRAPPLG